MLTYTDHTQTRTHTRRSVHTPGDALILLMVDENLAWKETMHSAGIKSVNFHKTDDGKWTLTIVAMYDDDHQLYTGTITP
jgi:hypothetical protein